MGVDASRCFVIPMGIRHGDFAPRWPKDPTVLFSGKLDVRKGIFEFLEAAARLPHVRFEVVGWGPDEAALRARATPNVTFHPFERGAKHRAHFARASIFCMPSHVETFGLALVEAQAAGCAVVSSVPLPFAGVSVPGKDVDALTRAIEELWSDPVRTEQAGRENLVMARQYDWDVYADKLLANYGRLVDSYQPVRGNQPMEMTL
jgi:glycosyltransferase involved in cell wall biosynthesis